MNSGDDFLMKIEAVRTRRLEKKDLLKSFFSLGISDISQSFTDAGRFFFELDTSETCKIYVLRANKKNLLDSFKMTLEDFEIMVLSNGKYEDNTFKYKFLKKSFEKNIE